MLLDHILGKRAGIWQHFYRRWLIFIPVPWSFQFGKEQRALPAQFVKATVARDPKQPWFDRFPHAERGRGKVELQKNMLQDIIRLAIVVDVAANKREERGRIPGDEHFKGTLIACHCLCNEDTI